MKAERFSGFYKKSVEERLRIIKEELNLNEEDIKILKETGSLDIEIADRMVENVIGAIHLPLGIATNFRVNGRDYIVPMAIEEPSVIAAASKAAKLTLPKGFEADADEPIMIGQLQLDEINPEESIKEFEKRKEEFFEHAKKFGAQMERYRGGLRDISIRRIDEKMVVVEFYVDVRDAMGANTINTIVEKSAPFFAKELKGKIGFRILTNLAIKRKVRAKAVWDKTITDEEKEGVIRGYRLAKKDIFRCATHNKGIMNGIDAVALATGNDWRAVEAGAHAYAAMNGYKPLTEYWLDDENRLHGKIELPLAVGTVGGAINTKPTAKVALKILGVKTAKELSMVMASVGLANNFAALRALGYEGIQKGHMKLHAKNLAVMAGAKTPEEIDRVVEELIKIKEYTVQKAKEILTKIRR